jgi:hypothetical protein
MTDTAADNMPTKARFYAVFKEKKTYPIDFEKNFRILVKKGEQESVSRLVYLLDENRTQVQEKLEGLYGERKYFQKEDMEPNVGIRKYLSILKGLAELEITESTQDMQEKQAALAKAEEQSKEAAAKDGEQKTEAEVEEAAADAKKEKEAKAKVDAYDEKAGFLRTPSTMLGFRWDDLTCNQNQVYRLVSLHQERASVLLALAICVSNQAVSESKVLSPATLSFQQNRCGECLELSCRVIFPSSSFFFFLR